MASPVTVLGAGSFGTCLAMLCSRERDVMLWARDAEVAEAINRERRNPRYLRDVEVPAAVRATGDLAEARTAAQSATKRLTLHRPVSRGERRKAAQGKRGCRINTL